MAKEDNFSKQKIYGALNDIIQCRNIQYTEIGKRFIFMADCIGLSKNEAIKILNIILSEFMNDKKLVQIETKIKNLLKKKFLLDVVNKKLGERAKRICSQVEPWIIGLKLLDIGSGDGRIARQIHKLLGKEIYLIDVINYRIRDLPFILYNGKEMPFSDDEFDTSLLLTTLHHTETPELLLEEALRVTKKRLIIIESIYFNEMDKKANLFFDWLCNRLEKNINLPFNFKTPTEWRNIFNKHEIRIIYEKDLGIDQPLAPEHHWLWVLDKVGKKYEKI